MILNLGLSERILGARQMLDAEGAVRSESLSLSSLPPMPTPLHAQRHRESQKGTLLIVGTTVLSVCLTQVAKQAAAGAAASTMAAGVETSGS